MNKDLIFEIRDYEYFKNKNIFSGSAGDFQYRIAPEGEILKASVWKGKKCFQLSEMLEEKEFSASEEGVSKTIEWIKQKFAQS